MLRSPERRPTLRQSDDVAAALLMTIESFGLNVRIYRLRGLGFRAKLRKHVTPGNVSAATVVCIEVTWALMVTASWTH